MRKTLAIILAITFITIAVFGFAGMNNTDSHGYRACIAATANGGYCNNQPNSLGFANFFISTFFSFSSTILTSGLAVSLLLLITLLTLVSDLALLGVKKNQPQIKYKFKFKKLDSGQNQFYSWLKFHTNSPTVT